MKIRLSELRRVVHEEALCLQEAGKRPPGMGGRRRKRGAPAVALSRPNVRGGAPMTAAGYGVGGRGDITRQAIDLVRTALGEEHPHEDEIVDAVLTLLDKHM